MRKGGETSTHKKNFAIHVKNKGFNNLNLEWKCNIEMPTVFLLDQYRQFWRCNKIHISNTHSSIEVHSVMLVLNPVCSTDGSIDELIQEMVFTLSPFSLDNRSMVTFALKEGREREVNISLVP